MFTGLITGVGTVRRLQPLGAGHDMRLEIQAPWADTAAIPLGASIACTGCCLTAVAVGPDWFAVDASAETLSKTKLGSWTEGTRVNLERSLRLGDELGGHLVSGHVDGRGQVAHATPEHGSLAGRLRGAARAGALHRVQGQRRGGRCVVDRERGCGHTLRRQHHPAYLDGDHARTARRPGDAVHIEIDMLARYVARGCTEALREVMKPRPSPTYLVQRRGDHRGGARRPHVHPGR